MISGVVLIAWRQEILQKQIDYGVKLGQVVLSLAKMELENFYKVNISIILLPIVICNENRRFH